jgi:hypothetical protein
MTEYVYSPSAGRRIEVEELDTGVQPSKARRRETVAYAQIALKLAAECAKATMTQQAVVWLLLRYMAWSTRSSTFPCPNGMMRRYGVSREVKRKALEKLEAAGLISVQQPRGCAPLVTLIGGSWALPTA